MQCNSFMTPYMEAWTIAKKKTKTIIYKNLHTSYTARFLLFL